MRSLETSSPTTAVCLTDPVSNLNVASSWFARISTHWLRLCGLAVNVHFVGSGFVVHRALRQRADIGQQRVLRAGPAGQRDAVGDLVLARQRAEVLPRGLEVAIDEAVPILSRDADLGDRPIALPVVGHAEVRQAAEVGVDVVRRDLDVVGRRPLGRDEAAPAIVGDIVAAGDVGVLEHAAGANREGRADHLVDVERDALGVVGAERALGVVEVAVARLLGDDIDGAAGGAAAGIGRGRATQDLDLLGEEVFADR